MREEIIAGGGSKKREEGRKPEAEWTAPSGSSCGCLRSSFLFGLKLLVIAIYLRIACISNFSKFIVNASLISRTEAHIRFKLAISN